MEALGIITVTALLAALGIGISVVLRFIAGDFRTERSPRARATQESELADRAATSWPENGQDDTYEDAGVKVVRRQFDSSADVSWPEELGVTEMKVRGVSYWVHYNERRPRGTCRLVREPNNEHDSHAVAVYIGDRKIGYIPASRAGMLSDMLDELNAPLVINYDLRGNYGSTYWLRLPTVPGLRKFMRGSAK